MSHPEIQIPSTQCPHEDEILSPAALDFIASLECEFRAQRRELLTMRQRARGRYEQGEARPDFFAESTAR